MRLKEKLSLGLGFLFIVILSFGILSIFYINRLSREAQQVLKNNHESLVYANNMLKALEQVPGDKNAVDIFDNNLKKQEANITEAGERDATALVRKNFSELMTNPRDSSNYSDIRQSIQLITDLNQQAILRKNAVAQKTASDATMLLTIIFTILTLIAFVIVVNFPGVISAPVKALAEGIDAIANQDYAKRIHLQQKDEFGDLANAFNTMAERLDEYEHSSLNKLMFEKKRIETIINQMKDAIIGLDDKRNILFLNAIAETLLGLKESDIAGKYAPDVALKNDLLRTLLQDGEKKELKIYADGKESYFSKENISVRNMDVVIGEVIVLRNLTSFYELNEAKTNFISTVSHELKTPISSIKMSAQLLADNRVGTLNPEQGELIRNIQDDAGRLLKITGELLNMAQVETGNIQLNIHPSDPEKIILQACKTVRTLAEQKNIHLRLQVPDNMPMVQADDEKTVWVLTNFISNAIRHSHPDSNIFIKAEVLDGQIKFSVRDTGQGIPAEYKDKIFNRYFRIPGTQKEGTGLGLAISKDFIEAQGGKIEVETELGVGSSFQFYLKRADG